MTASFIRLAAVRRAVTYCAMRAEDRKIDHAPLTAQWAEAHALCEAVGRARSC